MNALPTPRSIVETALQHYVVHVAQTAAEIAQSCEALRLLRERPEAADALFAPMEETVVPPPTDKQRDLLRKLGYPGAIVDRAHASRVIDDLLNKRRNPPSRANKPGKQLPKREQPVSWEESLNREHLRAIRQEGRVR